MSTYPEPIVHHMDPARSAGRMRQLPTDARNEAHIAAMVERRFSWSLYRYAPADPIDFYAVKDQRMAANIEIRCRSRSSRDSMWFSIATNKYHALFTAWLAFHVPSLYVVAFTDRVCWLDIARVEQHRPPRFDSSHAVTKGRSAGECFVDVSMDALEELEW